MRTSHLVTLMSRYYECVDRIHELQNQAAALKDDILNRAGPGRYGRYSVFQTKEMIIEVRGHTRRCYVGIRRGK